MAGTHGKAVFNVEYGGKQSDYCPLANSPAYDFNTIGEDRRPVRPSVRTLPLTTHSRG